MILDFALVAGGINHSRRLPDGGIPLVERNAMSIWRRWFPWAFEPEVSVRLEGTLPPEPRAPEIKDGIYARFGEQITCEHGHPIATFTREVRKGELFDENVLYFNGETAKPAMGTPAEDCICYLCEGRWFHGNGHFHFKDGWR